MTSTLLHLCDANLLAGGGVPRAVDQARFCDSNGQRGLRTSASKINSIKLIPLPQLARVYYRPSLWGTFHRVAQGHWAIKGGDATSGNLTVYWDGARPRFPSTERWPNSTDSPMKKQGSIILGIGGDNSHGGVGTFYVWLLLDGVFPRNSARMQTGVSCIFDASACHAQEGVMTRGYASNETDAAVQANSE